MCNVGKLCLLARHLQRMLTSGHITHFVLFKRAQLDNVLTFYITAHALEVQHAGSQQQLDMLWACFAT